MIGGPPKTHQEVCVRKDDCLNAKFLPLCDIVQTVTHTCILGLNLSRHHHRHAKKIFKIVLKICNCAVERIVAGLRITFSFAQSSVNPDFTHIVMLCCFPFGQVNIVVQEI